jgi:superoxide reductase
VKTRTTPAFQKAPSIRILCATVTAAAALALALAPTGAAAESQADYITPAYDHVQTGQDPKHTPKITAPAKVKSGEWFDVTVEIGAGKRHPSFPEHYVGWIALFKDDVEIARTYLHPVMSTPKVTWTIALRESATLRAMEAPNHNAPYVSEIEIEVEPIEEVIEEEETE